MKKILKYSLVFICITLTTLLSAQVQLERQVIGSAGSESNSANLKVAATVGEVSVETVSGGTIIYTQGFQQPFSSDTIRIVLSVADASCVGRDNGNAQIDSIFGCATPYTINWSAGRVLADGFSTFGLAPGDYTVQVVSSDGCENILPFTVGLVSTESCVLQFFSGISPNNDGLNDTWFIQNVEAYAENKVTIFTRLGNVVFRGKNYDNQEVVWKGDNLSGAILPSGTYFFIFESGDFIEKGWIELTR